MKTLQFCEPWLPELYADAVRAQVSSGWIGPGERTKEFANVIGHYAANSYCVLTVSGTVALTVAAQSAGLKPGDEILVPAYGIIATVNAFAVAGLKPRLVDIDPNTGSMSPQALEKEISDKTKAVCFVNFSGYTGPSLIEVSNICRDYSLILIEDASCALGQVFDGQPAGTFGDLGVYSFSVPKIVTTGQGGAIVSRNKDFCEKALKYTDHGDLDWRETNRHINIGTNLRFTDMAASLGLAQFQELDCLIQRKKRVHQALLGVLGEKLFSIPGEGTPLHNILLSPDSSRLVELLRAQKIMAARQYSTISSNPAYRDLAEKGYPGADIMASNAVYLPFGLSLSEDDGNRIAEAVSDSGVPLLSFSG